MVDDGKQQWTAGLCRWRRMVSRRRTTARAVMRDCARCRLAFLPRQKTQMYCSPHCRERERARAYTARQKAVRHAVAPAVLHCRHCAKAFPQDYTNKLYCGDRCQQLAFNARRGARRQAVAAGLPCRWCGLTTTDMAGLCDGRCRRMFGEWRDRYFARFGFSADW